MFDADKPWMTISMLIIGAMIVLVGGVVVIMGNMTFDEYLDHLKEFAIAVGLLGVGRGIASNRKNAPTNVINVPKS